MCDHRFVLKEEMDNENIKIIMSLMVLLIMIIAIRFSFEDMIVNNVEVFILTIVVIVIGDILFMKLKKRNISNR